MGWLGLLLWFWCGCFCGLAEVAAGQDDALHADVRALLEFKKGIRSDPSGRIAATWDAAAIRSDDGPCPRAWHGVTCADDGTVSGLALSGLGLSGELKFATLVGLRSLTNLSLSGNSLSGRLVPALGSMTTLRHLDLSDNLFYGPVPARISDLWGLFYLNLSSNNFTGRFPAGIRNLQQLKVLDLRSNRLYGDLGGLISELRNAEFVDLSTNLFYGQLFMDTGNLSSLANTVRHLNLSYNSLNGGFFSQDAIDLFKNLQVLDVTGNRINGGLPSFGSTPVLAVLRVGGNQLGGELPAALFGTSLPLSEVDLSGNAFTGSIPNVKSSTLRTLNLSSNQLSGPLPQNLDYCTILDLSNNALSGDLSAIVHWSENLEHVDLSSNIISGSFPNTAIQCNSLKSFKISNNSLNGALSSSLMSCQRLTSVDLSMNKLSGFIPLPFFNSLYVTSLNLSHNHLTGTVLLQDSHEIESDDWNSSLPMEILDLASNLLTGGLPSELGKMVRLISVSFANNSLSGHIPSDLQRLDQLEYLDLSGNNFQGTIPDKLSSNLKAFNVSYNNLSGPVPDNLRGFPITSFYPGNRLLVIDPSGRQPTDGGITDGVDVPSEMRHGHVKSNIKVAIIIGCVAAFMMIVFVSLAYYRTHLQEIHERGIYGQGTERNADRVLLSRPSFFNSPKNVEPPPSSLNISSDHLLPSDSRSVSKKQEYIVGGAECDSNVEDGNYPLTSRYKASSGSPLSSPRFGENYGLEQPVSLSIYSPDRLSGDLFFLDISLAFTAEELSRAPAEVLGRSSHGTTYKATLDSGHVLSVKWLRVGLVKRKKEFAKEMKRIGSVRHPNLVSLRAYYWGPREQEKLILADYVNADSLALHLYESTPRRHSFLSFSQRVKIATDVARSLYYLHQDRGLPHGNLKPTNIFLVGADLTAQLTDYGLHRLMTPVGTAEQILNLGALGYRAPELANTTKPVPSFKADVYALGVILMELLTRRSAGDIISGQSGAVDLTDWVRCCANEGRGMDCFDRDLTCLEETGKAMEELLTLSLRCILPVNERPNIRTVFEDLCSIAV